jgi:effector-binding domain-containing protein
MNHDVRLETVASIPLVAVRRQASLAELPVVIPPACGLVWNAVRDRGLQGAGRLVAIFWDTVFHLDVGVEYPNDFTQDGELIPSATPAGTVATATLFGPYSGLHEVHRVIRDWCVENGHKLAGPAWEIYGHWLEEWNNDPSQIRTDVFYLIASPASSNI